MFSQNSNYFVIIEDTFLPHNAVIHNAVDVIDYQPIPAKLRNIQSHHRHYEMRISQLVLVCLFLVCEFRGRPARGTLAQQVDEDGKDEAKDAKDDKDDKEEASEFPSLAPSPAPTTAFPTTAPVTHPPTFTPSGTPTMTPTVAPSLPATTITPTASPSYSPSTLEEGVLIAAELVESQLPEIVITIESSVPSTFSSSSEETENDVSLDEFVERMDPYFHSFVESLLITSRAISELAQPSTSLEIRFIPMLMNSDSGGDAMGKATDTANDTQACRTCMSVVIDGTVSFLDFDSAILGEKETSSTSSSIEDSIRHSLIVYFTLWGPGDMEEKLATFGLPSPKVKAVFVDQSQVMKENDDTGKGGLVAVDSNVEESVALEETGDGTNHRYSSLNLVLALMGGVAIILP